MNIVWALLNGSCLSNHSGFEHDSFLIYNIAKINGTQGLRIRYSIWADTFPPPYMDPSTAYKQSMLNSVVMVILLYRNPTQLRLGRINLTLGCRYSVLLGTIDGRTHPCGT